MRCRACDFDDSKSEFKFYETGMTEIAVIRSEFMPPLKIKTPAFACPKCGTLKIEPPQ